MWCPDCQEEFESVPGADVQVCPRCSAAARAGRRSRRIPKLNPDSSPRRIRIDGPHQSRTEKPESVKSVSNPARLGSTRSPVHVTTFGVLIFLIGQAILAWAFLAGHYTAWNVANIVSILGVTLAFFGVTMTIRDFEKRIEDLAKLVGRGNRRKRTRTRSSSRAE